jgi:hypothetical protein
MCDLISKDVRRQGSLMPEMFVAAASLASSAFPGPRLSYEDRIRHVFNILASAYKEKRGLTELKGRVPNRLWAFVKLAVDQRLRIVQPLPRLFVYSPANDFRVSLPPSCVAEFGGRLIFLVLYYNEKVPLSDEYGLTSSGQVMTGGLAIAFDQKEARYENGEPFELPHEIDDIIVVDVARQRKHLDAAVRQLSALRGLFLTSYCRFFVDILYEMSALYSEACLVLGIEDDARMKDDEPDHGSSGASEQPKKSA